MLSSIDSYKGQSKQYSSEDRQLYILFQLLIGDGKVTTNTLQEELFISRPSVYKDLQKVKEWLLDREIELVYDNKDGIGIKSGEKRIRKAIADFFFLNDQYDKIFDLVEKSNSYKDINFAAVNYLSYSQKEDILDVDYKRVYSILIKLQDNFKIKFTPIDLFRLTIEYSIAISRMLGGNYVDMKDSTMDELKLIKKYDQMSQVVKDIEKEFQIDIPTSEASYLTGLTIVTKTHLENINWNTNKKMLVLNNLVAQEIIELTKENYHISEEEAFYKDLVHHLKTVTNKIKYGLEFDNQNLDEIKSKYPEFFQIALKSKSIFLNYYGYQVPLEELGFIALYIGVAVERSKKPLSTYVVYHSSYSEIKLMVETLKNYFNQIVIEKILPISMVDTINIEEIDLIITTKKLSMDFDKQIILPTILTSDSLVKLSKIFIESYESENYKRLKKLP